jgi:predicted XRE-type DNA-binding protein
VPGAEQYLIKADIVTGIAERIKGRGLTRAEAARKIGLSRRDVSKLLRGNFGGYTLDRLFAFLCALGSDVSIRVAAPRRSIP